MAVTPTYLPASASAAPPADGGMSGRMLDFLAYLEFERVLSRNTLDAYRTDLLQFGRFLDEREVSALEAKPSDVADFLEALAFEDVLSAQNIVLVETYLNTRFAIF